jgi:phosphoribosylformylglycinamidine cyclo-ligase
MARTFNCGIGMVVIAEAGARESVLAKLRADGEKARLIGEVVARDGAARVALTGTLEFEG